MYAASGALYEDGSVCGKFLIRWNQSCEAAQRLLLLGFPAVKHFVDGGVYKISQV